MRDQNLMTKFTTIHASWSLKTESLNIGLKNHSFINSTAIYLVTTMCPVWVHVLG